MDRGAWWTAVHGVAKSRTRLSSFTLPFPFHALEKEMAAHSRVLAWTQTIILPQIGYLEGTGDTGRLPEMSGAQ